VVESRSSQRKMLKANGIANPIIAIGAIYIFR